MAAIHGHIPGVDLSPPTIRKLGASAFPHSESEKDDEDEPIEPKAGGGIVVVPLSNNDEIMGRSGLRDVVTFGASVVTTIIGRLVPEPAFSALSGQQTP